MLYITIRVRVRVRVCVSVYVCAYMCVYYEKAGHFTKGFRKKQNFLGWLMKISKNQQNKSRPSTAKI